jgi:hypothetical protein
MRKVYLVLSGMLFLSSALMFISNSTVYVAKSADNSHLAL